MFGVGEAPLVEGAGASRVYWFRPSLLCRFCGGRPDFLATGAGLRVSVGVSGATDSAADSIIAGSSTGVASAASRSAFVS